MIQSIVQNIIGPWKSGKFITLTLRPYSANTYVISNVWFKCSSVNLRVQDITTINSQINPSHFKPSVLVLFEKTKDGGLRLFHMGLRSLACQIRSFLETAANPNFRQSLFHEIL